MLIVPQGQGHKWKNGRWYIEATLVRRHGPADGPIDGANIPWVRVDGFYPVTITVEGAFTGRARIIQSARSPKLASEPQGAPSDYTLELGGIFPQLGQDLIRPSVITVNSPLGWVGLWLPEALTDGELSAFLIGSSHPSGG